MNMTVVACDTDALNDWEFDDHDQLVAPGGRAVAVALFDRLSKNAQPLTQPENHEDYGWWFELRSAGKRFWFLIASGPAESTMYVWVKPQQSWLGRFFGSPDPRQYILESIMAFLKADDRFKDVRIETPSRK